MTIRTAAYETNQLYKVFKEAADKDDHTVIPWGKLSEVAGVDVRDKGSGYVRTARKMAENESGKLFVTVIGEGVRLATVEDQAAEPDTQIRKVRRLSNRALFRLSHVTYEKLPDEAKARHNASASIFGAIKFFSRKNSIEKIEAQTSQVKLDVDKTIAAFTNGKT